MWFSWWKELISMLIYVSHGETPWFFAVLGAVKGRQHLNFREICFLMSEFPANSAVLKVPTCSKIAPDLDFGYLFLLRTAKKSLWSSQLFLQHDKKQTLSSYDAIIDIFKCFMLCLFPQFKSDIYLKFRVLFRSTREGGLYIE